MLVPLVKRWPRWKPASSACVGFHQTEAVLPSALISSRNMFQPFTALCAWFGGNNASGKAASCVRAPDAVAHCSSTTVLLAVTPANNPPLPDACANTPTAAAPSLVDAFFGQRGQMVASMRMFDPVTAVEALRGTTGAPEGTVRYVEPPWPARSSARVSASLVVAQSCVGSTAVGALPSFPVQAAMACASV